MPDRSLGCESRDRRRDGRRSSYGGHFFAVLAAQRSASFSELAHASLGVEIYISEVLEWIVQAVGSGLVEYVPMVGDTDTRRVRLTDRGRTVALIDRRKTQRRAA